MGFRDLLHAGITADIKTAFRKVHWTHGYGFAEVVYSNSMAVALGKMGLRVKREVPVEVLYDGVGVGTFRIDLLIGDAVIVEVKTNVALGPGDHKQLLNYLRASDVEVGLLLNFGPRPEFKRLVYSNARKLHRSTA